MEVVNDCAAFLSNSEVLSLLNDIQSGKGHKKPNSNQQNLATICYETSKHLERTPCKNQTPEVIANFVKKLQPYNLTKAEKLQLLNHQPTTGVEIQLLIEESEERLTEEQTEDLLNLISECLPTEETEKDTQEGVEQMDQS